MRTVCMWEYTELNTTGSSTQHFHCFILYYTAVVLHIACSFSTACTAGMLQVLPIHWPRLLSAARLVKGALHWFFFSIIFSLLVKESTPQLGKTVSISSMAQVGAFRRPGDVISFGVDSHFLKQKTCVANWRSDVWKTLAFARQARSNTRGFWRTLGEVKRSRSQLLWCWSFL